MGRRGPNYTVIPNDWANLEYIISDLCSRIIDTGESFSNLLPLDGSRPMTGDLDLGSNDITNVGTLSATNIDVANLTVSTLTETRVVFAGADGLLVDDADLTFITDTLFATNLTSSGTGTLGRLLAGGVTSVVIPSTGNDFSEDDNCKALWNFESPFPGQTIDDIGNNTLTNSLVGFNDVIFKQGISSAKLDQNSDRLTITDTNLDAGYPLKNGDSNKKISIAGWFRLDTLTGTAKVFYAKGIVASSLTVQIQVFGSNLGTFIGHSGGTGTEALTSSTVSAGIWYHLGFTYDDSDKSYQLRLYNDNTSLATTTTGNAANNIYVGTGVLGIGNVPVDNFGFIGLLDEIVAFNDILTISEIDEIRNGTYGPPPIYSDLHAFSENEITINHVTDSGDNIAVAGDSELQGDIYVDGDSILAGDLTVGVDSLVVDVGTDEVSMAGNLGVIGTGTFGQIIDLGLTASSLVWTDGSKQLTSTPTWPTAGQFGYWTRTGTTLSMVADTDTVTLGGDFTVGVTTLVVDSTLGTISTSGEILVSTRGRFLQESGGSFNMANNLYLDGATWRLTTADEGVLFQAGAAGSFNFFSAPTGAADSAATLTEKFRITNTGDVFIYIGDLTVGGSTILGDTVADTTDVWGVSTFGNVGTDYSTFEADGTLAFVGEACVWNDINTSFSSARVPAANAPTWTSFVGNLNEWTFGVNDYVDLAPLEMLHDYKVGTDFEVHLHWATNGLDGTDRAVNWEIEYTVANMLNATTTGVGDAFPATTVVTMEQTIPANTPDRTHMYLDLVDIVGTNVLVGAIVKFRVRRLASAGTAPSANPFALLIGAHYIMDTVGSRTEYTK